MKSFGELIKEYSTEYKTQQDRIKESNDFFSKNYLENSKYSSFSLPFVPGIIYSFGYKTPSKITEKRKFINRNPIFIFLNYSKTILNTIIIGVNIIVESVQKEKEKKL